MGSEPVEKRRASLALLAVGVLAMAFVAYEKAALTFAWFPHTISWYGHRYPLVRFSILFLIVAFGVWWLWHTAQPIEK